MNKPAIYILLLIFITSCSIFNRSSRITSDKAINKLNEENTNTVKFDWFKGKMKVNFSTDSFNGHVMVFLKIRNDSLIWGSVTAIIGFEIARFYITKQEVVLIDRIHTTYYRYPLSVIEEKFNIKGADYSLVQNFLTGNALFYLDGNFTQEKDENNIIFYFSGADLSKTLYADKKTLRINRYILKNDLLKDSVVIDYKDKIRYRKLTIPKEITINAFGERTVNINMKYTMIQFGQPMEFNMEIPENYIKGN